MTRGVAASRRSESRDPITPIVRPLAAVVKHVGQAPQQAAGVASSHRAKNGTSFRIRSLHMLSRIER
jgi:hypothetical protein